MSRIKALGDVNCSCLHGTPVVTANGGCSCTSTVGNAIPPMPATILPTGFVWKWNGVTWIPTRVTTISVDSQPLPPYTTFVAKAKAWAQANPLMALAVGGGALYFLTKGK